MKKKIKPKVSSKEKRLVNRISELENELQEEKERYTYLLDQKIELQKKFNQVNSEKEGLEMIAQDRLGYINWLQQMIELITVPVGKEKTLSGLIYERMASEPFNDPYGDSKKRGLR